jgi:putative flippase GtrA
MNLFAFKRSTVQVVRYIVVGVVVNSAGYIFYLASTGLLRLEPLIAITIIYSSASIANYFGNKTWTFGDRNPLTKTAPKYLAAQVVGYFTNIGIIQVFHGSLGMPHAYVQLFAVFFVAVEIFLLSKCLVFRAAK